MHIITILKLIENGLLRIAIADERSWDYLAERLSFAEELTLCGVYPVRQVLTFQMPEEINKRGDVGALDIDKVGDKLTILPEIVEPEIIIIHQGILDKIGKTGWSSRGYKDQDAFLKELKSKIPIVVVTSGRGEPSNLSIYAKFMGFSILEQHVVSDPHSKLILTDSLMKLSRNYERKENES